jgi:4-hydroxy-2-oxoheptanedioate aldolase
MHTGATGIIFPHIDALMLGADYLRVAMGLPSRRVDEHTEPEFEAAIDQLVKVSQQHRKPLTAVSFKAYTEIDTCLKHFQLVFTAADFLCVVKGHQQA